MKYLEVRKNENVTYLLPLVTFNSYFSVTYCLVFILFPLCHNKKMYCISLTSHAKSTSSRFTENQEAGLNSLSAIKVIIRENEEIVFPQKERFSQ